MTTNNTQPPSDSTEASKADGGDCPSASCSQLAKCSVCGHITNDFVTYGSLAHSETCPAEMPHICGFSCMADAGDKIKAGEWRVPKLRKAMGGYAWDISKPRQGYDAQPSQADLTNALIHDANSKDQSPEE